MTADRAQAWHEKLTTPVRSQSRERPARPALVKERARACTYLWAASDPADWQAYFEELIQARGLNGSSDRGAWLGLNVKGRTFGSALGAPRSRRESSRLQLCSE